MIPFFYQDGIQKEMVQHFRLYLTSFYTFGSKKRVMSQPDEKNAPPNKRAKSEETIVEIEIDDPSCNELKRFFDGFSVTAFTETDKVVLNFVMDQIKNQAKNSLSITSIWIKIFLFFNDDVFRTLEQTLCTFLNPDSCDVRILISIIQETTPDRKLNVFETETNILMMRCFKYFWKNSNFATKSQIISILSLFPRDFEYKTKEDFFKEALHDKSEDLKAIAIKSIPDFIEAESNRFLDEFYPIMKSLIQSSSTSPLILESLCSIIPQVISSSESFDFATWKPFFELVKHSDKNVTLYFLKSLPTIIKNSTHQEIKKNAELFKSVMEIMKSKDKDLRKCFQEVIESLMSPSNHPMLAIFGKMSSLHEFFYQVFGEAQRRKDPDLLRYTLTTIGLFGAYTEGDFQKDILFFLLECLSPPPDRDRLNTIISDASYEALVTISKKKSLNMEELFKDYQSDVFRVISDKIMESTINVKYLQDVALLLYEIQDEKVFILQFLRQILQVMVGTMQQHDDITPLYKLSKIIDIPLDHMVADNLEPLISGLLLAGVSKSNLSRFIENLIVKCDLRLPETSNLITVKEVINKFCLQGVVATLCMEYGNEQEGHAKKIDEAFQSLRDLTESKSVISLIRGHFNAFMDMKHGFNMVLDKGSNQDWKNALRALQKVISKIGTESKNFEPQIISALKKAIVRIELRTQALETWQTFVNAVGTDVGPLLNQILVELEPYYDSQIVVSILEFLIIENRKDLKKWFGEIPTLPPLQSLAKVIKVISEETGVQSLEVQIGSKLKGIDAESLDVRKVALTQLIALFQDQYEMLTTIVSKDPLDENISQAILKILERCNDGNLEIRNLAAKCLGLIGAVAPSRVKNSKPPVIPREMDEAEFGIHLLKEYLYKILVSHRKENMISKVSYTVQEVLKHLFKLENKDTDMLMTQEDYPEWFKQLPENMRYKFIPYLKSEYKPFQYPLPEKLTMIYQPEMSLKKWLKEWSRVLIPKTKRNVSKIFIAARAIMIDPKTAIFILPYLVTNVTKYGTNEDRVSIRDEILHVLNNAQYCSEHVQTLFVVIDTMTAWLESYMTSIVKTGKIKVSEDQQYRNVATLLNEIPKDVLAKSAYHIQAYARALMWFEIYMREEKTQDKTIKLTQSKYRKYSPQEVSELHRIYSCLAENDGIQGIVSLRMSRTLEEEFIDYKNEGNWSSALNCCEISLEKDSNDILSHKNALECLINLGNLQMVLNHMDGMVNLRSEGVQELKTYGVHASWRLGQWDKVKAYSVGTKDDFNVGIGKALLALVEGKQNVFLDEIETTRIKLLEPLGAASMESYLRSYPIVVNLQILSELEMSWQIATQPEKKDKIVKSWENSLKSTEKSLQYHEPILALRQVLYSIFDMKSESNDAILKVAKLARKAGHYQNATSSLLRIKTSTPHIIKEKAKILWSQQQHGQAISFLEQALDDIPITDPFKPKLKLMVENWNQITYQKHEDELKKEYEMIIAMTKSWQDAYFYYAKYLDALFTRWQPKRKSSSKSKDVTPSPSVNTFKEALIPEIIFNYGNALKFGHKSLYESLPRLLTLWFDFGTDLMLTLNSSKKGSSTNLDPKTKTLEEILEAISRKIKNLLDTLPTYQWMSVLAQLNSRICHKNSVVADLLMKILCKIFVAYPHQALWSVSALKHSIRDEERKRKAKTLLTMVSDASSKENRELIEQSFKLFPLLIDICTYNPSGKGVSIPLNRVPGVTNFSHHFPLKTVIPLYKHMTITLPPNIDSTDTHYNPFPHDMATLHGFKDQLDILNSAQKPKKLSFVGNNNKLYPFLCKPKDDLRKDSRMMEFNTILNRFLQVEPESRKRNLYLRTFSCIPLDEENGLIEWVSDTETVRSVITDMLAEIKIEPLTTDQYSAAWKDPKKKNQIERLKTLQEIFPPVIHKWYLKRFPEPAKWFQSRLNFTRTYAVWCMIGHTTGLGDRHTENILFDRQSGDVVMVDFSCLFEKGKKLTVPETTPFRLTQNFVEAMGVTGVEGVFRKTCEVTMELLRRKKDTLMNVLDTFVHDPLVEWQDALSKSKEVMQVIEKKLLGFDEGISIPLNVQGQVQKLISQASSPENLSLMYIWWMPWL